MACQAAPLGIGEVALICLSHAGYPTERSPQSPFSDCFHPKFASDVRLIASHLYNEAFAYSNLLYRGRDKAAHFPEAG